MFIKKPLLLPRSNLFCSVKIPQQWSEAATKYMC